MAAGRIRKGRPLHGWLNIDKPVGMSSARCVGAVRRATGAAKAGHAGTLDPLASGVLPIALGEATKTIAHIVDTAKAYDFTVRWGERRATDDAEGDVVERNAARPTAAEIDAALPRFIGQIEQVPPAYSAVKVGGRRAYASARAGETVVLAARTVRVDALRLVDMPDRDRARLRLDCGKGTYVRSLARDLAGVLGTCGYVAALRRTRVGPFDEGTVISLDKLEQLRHIAAAKFPLMPIESALADIPAMALSADDVVRLRHGQTVLLAGTMDRTRGEAIGDDTVVLARGAAGPVALVKTDGGRLMPLRVFNL